MQKISVSTADALLDFTGGGRGPVSAQAAREQLEGAVAIHNILAEHNVAYLADEVGMGKTYVALGVLALLRHFQPTARVLVLAPRENIQKKWIKELRNFVDANVRFADLRVKAVHGAPARAPIFCKNVPALMHECILDPDRDMFARMTSFSLSLGSDSEGWAKLRDGVLAHVPWLDKGLFDLRRREPFKQSVGLAVNAALPEFDLVIVDEGHNLKHGLGSGVSTRNQLLSLAFGHPAGTDDLRTWATYGPRARRVLFLSATPLEDDYRQLWNQLDVFGKGDAFEDLLDGTDPDAQHACAAKFLIRRIAGIEVNGQRLTKNLYRREWRSGGVATHDDAIDVVDPKQQLVVALVQKKVAELLGSERFKNSFQIGMLASFESFLQTAGVRVENEDAVFDDADQALDVAERQGVDVHAVNRMAADYRRRFGRELPHPKMDATVDRLASAFTTGEKSLVFVRRVASVDELRRKLNERYDDFIIDYMRTALLPALVPEFDRAVDAYRRERLTADAERTQESIQDEPPEDDSEVEDAGGEDSFFAWYFRGKTPVAGLLSGGQFALRFNSAGAVLGTFFDDNHVSALLGAEPGGITTGLARAVAMPVEEMAALLREAAGRRLPSVKKQQRGTVFLAYQAAALALLAEHAAPELAQHARVMLEERFADMPEHSRSVQVPALEERLETRTFWTELRRRPTLRSALWPEPHGTDFREQFRERELRREMLSSMARLGHPMIDLYVSSVNATESLRSGSRQAPDEEIDDVRLIDAYLDALDARSAEIDWTGYHELKDAADHFDLILRTNEPDARTVPLHEASRLFGRLLRAQEPVGGMSGQVNDTLVRQFRMPGYPLVLITTELLREGEDLHTFCSNVVHYGISWMPSSMEQRVGRIDRVSSLTERRLLRLGTAHGDELLQVYYPYLKETVERVQVERVLYRQFEFLRLMHERIGTMNAARTIDLEREATCTFDPLVPITEPLRTAYPVREWMLDGDDRALAVDPSTASGLRDRLAALPDGLQKALGPIDWEAAPPPGTLLGTRRMTRRVQPFTLLLRSAAGRPLIRCVSPVGFYDELDIDAEELLRLGDAAGVRVCAMPDPRLGSYDVTVEGDVLLADDGTSDVSRVRWLLDAVTRAADDAERILLEVDRTMTEFRKDLGEEVHIER